MTETLKTQGRERKTGRNLFYFLLVLLILSLVYNVFDNNRFIIVEQEIVIDRLPQSFDGFRILQIADLHGKYFGENQTALVQAINRLDYDMIALTGDMNNSTTLEDSPANSQAILDLLDGISNKAHVFWVDGNTGPHAIEDFEGAKTGEVTKIGAVLQEKRVTGLTLPYAITRGKDRIWITPEMSETDFDLHYRLVTNEDRGIGGKENYARIQSFYQTSYAAYQAINGNGEVKILLTHAPKQTNLSAEELKQYGNGELDYDLILAGHYHGGQLRLPLIGALYIPSPTTGINNIGFFPPQSDVKGISYFGETPQYVSAGLGTSGHVRWLNFRLFNPPEINVITLKRK